MSRNYWSKRPVSISYQAKRLQHDPGLSLEGKVLVVTLSHSAPSQSCQGRTPEDEDETLDADRGRWIRNDNPVLAMLAIGRVRSDKRQAGRGRDRMTTVSKPQEQTKPL